MEVDAGQITSVAKGISDLGMMAVTAGVFLLLSMGLMISCFVWFKSLINGIINDNRGAMQELLDETRAQNEKLTDISEGLRPETQLRIKNTANVFFDLAVEKVCRIIKKVREENHIVDHEATAAKIRTLIGIRDSKAIPIEVGNCPNIRISHGLRRSPLLSRMRSTIRPGQITGGHTRM